MDSLSQEDALLIINGLPHIGPVTLQRLREVFEPSRPDFAVAILKSSPQALMEVRGVGPEIATTLVNWRKHFDLSRERDLLAKHNALFVTRDSLAYPPLLREIYDAPAGLYMKGTLSPNGTAVGLVGTRRPTLYGRSIARKLARELASRGICVVSGMARGIDTEAHEGALEAGGPTAAVLGNGVDIVYPPENLDLYHRIAEKGIVLSEFPIGRKADKQSFPRRNRVISGICSAIVVIESDKNGGSMITARFAGEQGRQLLAIPGRIDQPAAAGCHALIRDGATLCTGVEDILEAIKYQQPELKLDLLEPARPASRAPKPIAPSLDPTEATIATLFADGAVLNATDVAERTNLPYPTVTSTLLMLELKRILQKRLDSTYERLP